MYSYNILYNKLLEFLNIDYCISIYMNYKMLKLRYGGCLRHVFVINRAF